jgi:Spy/CpxP family protein refolding chaperone
MTRLFFASIWLGAGLSVLAIDPVVVHYDDPELNKLEKQLAITPAQKDQFDDIVVKYRDTGIAGNNPGAQGSGGRRGRRGPRKAVTSGAPSEQNGEDKPQPQGNTGGARRQVSKEEIEELKTVLTPSQLQAFISLHQSKRKHRR